MAATVVRGQSIAFGLEAESAGLAATQSVSLSYKTDKKEARNRTGNVVAVAYYNQTGEISCEGLGFCDKNIGDAISLSSDFPQVAGGSVIVEEVSYTRSNEDFLKSTVKATWYSEVV